MLFQLLRNHLLAITKSYIRVRFLHRLCIPILLHSIPLLQKVFQLAVLVFKDFINVSGRPGRYRIGITKRVVCIVILGVSV